MCVDHQTHQKKHRVDHQERNQTNRKITFCYPLSFKMVIFHGYPLKMVIYPLKIVIFQGIWSLFPCAKTNGQPPGADSTGNAPGDAAVWALLN